MKFNELTGISRGIFVEKLFKNLFARNFAPTPGRNRDKGASALPPIPESADDE